VNAVVRPFQPIDDLEKDLVDSWRAVSQATHGFLTLLREFDLRQGWQAYGNNDCAEWLNWRCGIARNTAQEKVRTARALWDLPQIDEAFRRGDLSYSKVRALTRIALPQSECELLRFALDASAAQVEAYCRRLRNGDPAPAAADARRALEGRSLTRYLREDGTGTISVELPGSDLDIVMQALEKVGQTLPDDTGGSLFARAADALVEMARMTLAGESAGRREPAEPTDQKATGSSAETHQVIVRIDESALRGAGGQSDHPLPTVRRLCCDGPVIPLVQSKAGEVLHVGRRQRTVTTSLRRALEAQGRLCAFPGCHHERFLDAHHIHHWADGGETDLDNLMLLCTHHHTLVHEGGFSIRREPDGSCVFLRPDGKPVDGPSPCEVAETRANYLVDLESSSSAEDDMFERIVGPHVRARLRGIP
jgi:hypothetical protein